MGFAGSPTSTRTRTTAASGGGRPPDRVLPVVAAVIVAAMLLVASISLWAIFPDVEEQDSSIRRGVLVVEGDVVWEGRTGVMDHPVEVRRGGALTLRDCDLQVPLERLVVDGWPWFSGHRGSRITLDGSTVTIVADPAWAEAVFLDVGPDYYGPWHRDLALLWRAVDLRDARDPVLTLDVNPMNRSGDLVVAVQPSPGEDMEVLQTLSLEGGGAGGWEDLSVDLSPHAGEIIGLTIASVNGSMDGVLLKQVRVTDGGADLPGDPFPTGDPGTDGWYTHGIGSLRRLMRDVGFSDLISTEGNLALLNSTLSGPHLPRGDGTSVGDGAKSRLSDRREGFNVMSLSRGGNVDVWAGAVRIAGSTLDNVTVDASNSQVLVDESSFVADREQVTLYQCWGSITDCAFRYANGSSDPGDDRYLPREPDLWAVSVWGDPVNLWGPPPSGPFSITGCEFRDSVMGVDLARTWAVLEDCTFLNISWIAVWDHMALEPEGWEHVRATNLFEDCGHTLYFRTHDYEVTYHHRDWSYDEWDDYIWTDGEVVDSDGGNLPTNNLIWTWTAFAEMYMPTTIVNATGGVVRPRWVEVYLRVEWADNALERLSTEGTERIVDFSDRNREGVPWSEADVVFPSLWPDYLGSPEVDRAEFGLSVSAAYGSSYYIPAAMRDLEVEARMDGELLATYDVEDEGGPYYGSYWFNATLDLPPGPHVFNFTLTAAWNDTGERTYLDGWNISMARVDGNASTGNLSGRLDGDLHVLLMDPGTNCTVTGGDVSGTDLAYQSYWEVFLGEGAVLTFRDIAVDDDTDVFLTASGPGGVVLEDLDVDIVDLAKVEGWARLSNVTSDLLDLDAYNSDVVMEDCYSTPVWWGIERSTVQLERCRMDLSRDWEWTVRSSNLTVVDCDLNSSGRGFSLDVADNDVRFIDTRFRDVDLSLDIWGSLHGNLEVRGCDFSGEAALLNLTDLWSWSVDHGNMSRVSVSGNTFNGPAAGVSVDETIFGDVVSENALVGGARYLLWYNVTPRFLYENGTEVWGPSDYRLVPEEDLTAIRDLTWRYYHDRLLFAMETGDGGTPPEPPIIRVALEYWYYTVWFMEVDLAETSPIIQIPDWGQHTLLFLDLVRGQPGGNFWED